MLKRRLQARHVNMIAIGGSIGTGLFLASGYSISVGGPAGAMLAYVVMAVIVYFLMTGLAEMSAYKPSSGSFCDYSTEYVGKSFGVAMGYNYWLSWASCIAVELSAASLIMSFWFPQVNQVLFSLIFFIAIVVINFLAVRVYGEAEFWLSSVKVAAIIVFIVLGVFSVVSEPHFGVFRWQLQGAPFHNGWHGFIMVFLFVGLSFQGTELVGVASEETINPQVTIPKSIKMVFWRIALFYIVSILIISLLINYNDPRLVTQDSVVTSPYTMVFKHYVGNYAADIVNLVILIAVLSAANSSLYSASRILWYLGKSKQAPAVFARLDKRSLPIVALGFTSLIGALVFVSSLVGNGVFFNYIVQVSSLAGFLVWLGISVSHYRFRKNFLPQHGGVACLQYKARFFPLAPIASIVVIVAVIIGQCYDLQGGIGLKSLAITYSSLILFIIVYLSHKISTKIKS